MVEEKNKFIKTADFEDAMKIATAEVNKKELLMKSTVLKILKKMENDLVGYNRSNEPEIAVFMRKKECWQTSSKYGGVVCSGCGNYELHPTEYCSKCGAVMVGYRVQMENIT